MRPRCSVRDGYMNRPFRPRMFFDGSGEEGEPDLEPVRLLLRGKPFPEIQ